MTANESGGFRPLDKLSRAEAVTILNRIYNFLNRNFWLTDYTTIDLDSSGTAAGAGSSGSSGSGSGGTAIGSGSVIGAGSGGYNYNAGSIGSGSGLTIRDYFDDKGVIKKDVMKYGGPETPIETAVEIGNNRYLTIDLKSAEKNNLTIFFFDGNQAHVKQDELPITIKVEGYRVIGIKSALSEPNVNKQTDYSATLSVSLSQVEPEKPPKKKK
jgi:hypothetical protein